MQIIDLLTMPRNPNGAILSMTTEEADDIDTAASLARQLAQSLAPRPTPEPASSIDDVEWDRPMNSEAHEAMTDEPTRDEQELSMLQGVINWYDAHAGQVMHSAEKRSMTATMDALVTRFERIIERPPQDQDHIWQGGEDLNWEED